MFTGYTSVPYFGFTCEALNNPLVVIKLKEEIATGLGIHECQILGYRCTNSTNNHIALGTVKINTQSKSGEIRLAPSHDNKCVKTSAAAGDNIGLELATCSSTSTATTAFEVVAAGNASLVAIKVKGTNFCLNRESSNNAVKLRACNSASTQQWSLETSTTMRITGSGMCLSLTGSATTIGTVLKTDSCQSSGSAASAQTWLHAESYATALEHKMKQYIENTTAANGFVAKFNEILMGPYAGVGVTDASVTSEGAESVMAICGHAPTYNAMMGGVSKDELGNCKMIANGSSCDVNCLAGWTKYQPFGSNRLECHDANMDTANLNCVGCNLKPDLTSIANVNLASADMCQNVPPGFRCDPQCNAGYMAKNMSDWRCQENAWNSTLEWAKCDPIIPIYQSCAEEGGDCFCYGTVVYGKKYATTQTPGSGVLATVGQMRAAGSTEQPGAGKVKCDSSVFGTGVAPGYTKYCQCAPSSGMEAIGTTITLSGFTAAQFGPGAMQNKFREAIAAGLTQWVSASGDSIKTSAFRDTPSGLEVSYVVYCAATDASKVSKAMQAYQANSGASGLAAVLNTKVGELQTSISGEVDLGSSGLTSSTFDDASKQAFVESITAGAGDFASNNVNASSVQIVSVTDKPGGGIAVKYIIYGPSSMSVSTAAGLTSFLTAANTTTSGFSNVMNTKLTGAGVTAFAVQPNDVVPAGEPYTGLPSVGGSVGLTGMSVSQFNAKAQLDFKQAIASNLTQYMPDGACNEEKCGDIVINGFDMKGGKLSVDYSVYLRDGAKDGAGVMTTLNKFMGDATPAAGFHAKLNEEFAGTAATDGTAALSCQACDVTKTASAAAAVDSSQKSIDSETTLNGIPASAFSGNSSELYINAFKNSIVQGLPTYGLSPSDINIIEVVPQASGGAVIKWSSTLPVVPPPSPPTTATDPPPPTLPTPSTTTFAADVAEYLNKPTGNSFKLRMNGMLPAGAAVSSVTGGVKPKTAAAPVAQTITSDAAPALSGLVVVPESTISSAVTLGGLNKMAFDNPLLQTALKKTMMGGVSTYVKSTDEIVIGSYADAAGGGVSVAFLVYAKQSEVADAGKALATFVELPCVQQTSGGTCLKRGATSPFQTAFNKQVADDIATVSTSTSFAGFLTAASFDLNAQQQFKETIGSGLSINPAQIAIKSVVMAGSNVQVSYDVDVPKSQGSHTVYNLDMFLGTPGPNGFQGMFQSKLSASAAAGGASAPTLSGITFTNTTSTDATGPVTGTTVTVEPKVAGPGVTVAPTPAPTPFVPGATPKPSCPSRPTGGSLVTIQVPIDATNPSPSPSPGSPTPPPTQAQTLADSLQSAAALLAAKIANMFAGITTCDLNLKFADVAAGTAASVRRLLRRAAGKNETVMMTMVVYAAPGVNVTLLTTNMQIYVASPLFAGDVSAVTAIVAPQYKVEKVNQAAIKTAPAPDNGDDWWEEHGVWTVMSILLAVCCIVTMLYTWGTHSSEFKPSIKAKVDEDDTSMAIEMNQNQEDELDLQETGVGSADDDSTEKPALDEAGKDMMTPGVDYDKEDEMEDEV